MSQNKNNFIDFEIEGIKTRYKGSKGYLRPDEHHDIINYLETKDYWNFNKLENHIKEKYGVAFKSKQSYCDLFHEAKVSGKKTQKNPKKDDEDERSTVLVESTQAFLPHQGTGKICHGLWFA